MAGWPEIKQYIDAFFLEMRNSALTRGTVLSQNQNGRIVDNFFQDPAQSGGKPRNRQVDNGIVSIGKKVTPDMRMIIKHNAAFTALLPSLMREFPAYAIIRHPLWALASWNSNNLPISDGHVPMAEQLDRKLAGKLASLADRFDRQIFILSWMYEKFSLLDARSLISYESIVGTGGKALSGILPEAEALSENLTSNNFSERYPHVPLDDLAKRLRKRGGAYFAYYPRETL
jgi:hypothetical protein